ncbi:MAG: hypothetical protein NXH78_00810 [Hyphomonadaceae bacterium]|nr:hypothetical protein [Hyphomonadaceae bacterium]
MSDATFQTFLTSGLFVLTASIGYLAWSAWRWLDRARDMEKAALVGVGYELRMNLMRMIQELAGVEDGSVQSEIQLVPVVHPQLDGILIRPNEADRESLTMMRGNYNELDAHKQTLRAALSGQGDVPAAANVAVDAVIGSIATLYLWEEHAGAAPKTARSTRSWHVRDWMKANDFRSDLLPGLHLRDAVVERLRELGMTLTPKPLTYTASEYYAKLYDRKADPNAPFWKRKAKPAAVAEEAETPPEAELEAASEEADMAASEADAAPEPVVEPEPAVEPEMAAEPDPAMEPEQAAVPEAEPVEVESAEPEATDEPDLSSGEKPPNPGVVH